MSSPAPARTNAKTARTVVSDGVLGFLSGVTTGVGVSDNLASAVRVSRIKASWVAAPGEGDTVVLADPGVRVAVTFEEAVRVGVIVTDGVLVTVWKGEVGVGVAVRVGVSDL